MEQVCTKAKDIAGGPTALCEKIVTRTGRAITPQAISQWKVVPAAWVADVAAITGITCEELRPDVFRAGEAA